MYRYNSEAWGSEEGEIGGIEHMIRNVGYTSIKFCEFR